MEFGLLGKDFRYRQMPNTPRANGLGKRRANKRRQPRAPSARFASESSAVYNVIDTRQAYVQEVVAEGFAGRTGSCHGGREVDSFVVRKWWC